MTILTTLSLALAMLIFAATPGPAVFATVSRSMASGFRPSLSLIAGIITGDIIYLLFAVFGLSMVAQVLGRLFIIVKIAGGAYLFWLGIKMWTQKVGEDNPLQSKASNSWQSNAISGLLITLSNPKVILFYCGFLPTFMDLTSMSFVDVLILAAVITTVLCAVMLVYAGLASRARYVFTSRRAIKRMDRTAGGVMMAAGVTVALKS